MGQHREITKTLTLAATGGADTLRVWDAPAGEPIKNITITVSSGGTPTTAANIDYDVLFGGQWAGSPFAEGSTHSGGVSQSSGTLAAATEIAHIVFEDASIIPSNRIGPTVQHDMRRHGFPVVLELKNKGASPITLFITFISETVSTNV